MVVILQIFLGLLDIVGVLILGVVGSLAVGGVSLRKPGDRVSRLLEILNIDQIGFRNQIIVLTAIGALFLIVKTLISLYVSRKVLYFLSNQGARLASRVVKRLLQQPLLRIQSKPVHETIYAVTTGMNVVTVGIIGALVFLISDVSLLAILTLGLFVVDTAIALSTLVLFSITAFFLFKIMNRRAMNLGAEFSSISIHSQGLISQVLMAYREITVKNRRMYFASKISKTRENLAHLTAEMAFMQNISKFTLELTLVIGTLIICGIQFAIETGAHAIAVLSIFLAASTRIAPAVMRIQQGLVQIRGNMGSGISTLNLISEFRHLGESGEHEKQEHTVDFEYPGFRPEIVINDLTFRYPGSESNALDSVSIKIPAGSTAALVGPSGAGKTTLVDVILGIIEVDQGSSEISGHSAESAIKKWSGAIAYVPQDIVIFDGSLLENICLGHELDADAIQKARNAASIASLDEFINSLPLGLDTQVGDRGTSLSGGQRQRVGIARALFTKPKLIILDEATSSLDGETEALVTKAVNSLSGHATLLIVAHRLSTVRNADLVIYMENGVIKHQGTFAEVRKASPNFDRQASLMGIISD